MAEYARALQERDERQRAEATSATAGKKKAKAGTRASPR